MAAYVVENLTFFADCGLDIIDESSKGLFDNGITAKNVIFAGHEVNPTDACRTNIANMKKLSTSGVVHFAPLLTTNGSVVQECLHEKTSLDLINCIYKKTEKVCTNLLMENWGLSISSEGEKQLLGSHSQPFVAGTYRHFHKKKIFKMAGGDEPLSICNKMIAPGIDILPAGSLDTCNEKEDGDPPDIWAPEKSYEPGRQNTCQDMGSKGFCCDGPNPAKGKPCDNLWYKPCNFEDGKGWAKQNAKLVPNSNAITIGYRGANSMCNAANEQVLVAGIKEIKRDNVTLYLRQ